MTKARGHFGNGGIENRLFANGGGRNALMSSVRIASGARQTETDISIIFEKERTSLLFGKRASFFLPEQSSAGKGRTTIFTEEGRMKSAAERSGVSDKREKECGKKRSKKFAGIWRALRLLF